MEIFNKKIEEIKQYSKNAKKHSTKQIEQIANSIREFGFNQPIVVDKNDVVVVGHGRLEGAKLLGMEEVPVLMVDISETKAKAYRLADNKLNESDWDMDLVMEELKDLSEMEVNLSGFGLMDLDLEKINNTDLDLKEIFKIEIECENFEDQKLKYEQLIAENYKCKLLNL